MSIFNYQSDGIEPQGLNPAAQMAFMFIRDQLDRDGEKYRKLCEKNRENGKAGGRPSKTERFFEKPTKNLNDTDNDNDTDTVSDNDTEGCAAKDGVTPDAACGSAPAARKRKREKKTVGSFDTDEFFEAALKRSYNLSPQDTG